VAEHGCTVHIVTPDLDSGPVLVQKRVPVEAGDTADTLAARVLREEHSAYPQALRAVAAQIVEE
jgi:phosphoribosylglycinamide formyltransferase 1